MLLSVQLLENHIFLTIYRLCLWQITNGFWRKAAYLYLQIIVSNFPAYIESILL